jgi:DNA-binding CsgD family transcriptional regulator
VDQTRRVLRSEEAVVDQRVAVPSNLSAHERVVRHLLKPPGLRDLRGADLLAVLEFAEYLSTFTDAAAVPSMLEGVADLVGADCSTLTRINLRTGHEEAVVWPAARANSAVLAQYAEVSRTHPLRPPLAFQARSGVRRPAPIRISDVLMRRQWRASALYAASHRGIDDQMCVLIAAQQHTIQLVVTSRYHGSFTDRQVALLNAARVHLALMVQRIGRQLLPALQVAPTLRKVLAPVALPHPADRTALGPAAGRSVGRPTARQREILALVAEGMTDAQIGRRLGLTAATVSKHLTRSYARLGVPNRVAAARLIGSADPVFRTG